MSARIHFNLLCNHFWEAENKKQKETEYKGKAV